MQKKMRTLENIRTLSSVVARRINRVKLQPNLMTKRENSFLTGSSYLNNFLNTFGTHLGINFCTLKRTKIELT